MQTDNAYQHIYLGIDSFEIHWVNFVYSNSKCQMAKNETNTFLERIYNIWDHTYDKYNVFHDEAMIVRKIIATKTKKKNV